MVDYFHGQREIGAVHLTRAGDQRLKGFKDGSTGSGALCDLRGVTQGVGSSLIGFTFRG